KSMSSSTTEQCRYKHGGLVKQSFSITTTNHQKLHLICYYTKADVVNDKLPIPTHDEKLKIIHIPKGMYPETSNVDGVPHVHHYGSVILVSVTLPHRLSAEPMQFDSNSACSTPSISSSPSTTEDDIPNFFGRSNYFQHHNGGSTASLPVYPPSNYIQPVSSSDGNGSGFGNGTQPINIPNATPRFTFPALQQQPPFPASYPPQSSSQSNGAQLLPQDIPWEKIKNTEDQRQLNAIHMTLKL
ncbi:15600_t:CDS:2, partial [Acaulospora morrowiae]